MIQYQQKKNIIGALGIVETKLTLWVHVGKLLWSTVERSLNCTQDHQQPCQLSYYHAGMSQKCKKMSVELYSCLTHPERQDCSALSLPRASPQVCTVLGKTWNEATTVLKSNPSQSLQSSGTTWEPQAALVIKNIIFWEGDWCQCHLQCSFIRGTCRPNTPQTICL